MKTQKAAHSGPARADVTVVATAEAGDSAVACLSSPGLREIANQVHVIVVGDQTVAESSLRAGAEHLPSGRPCRAAARNLGLAAAQTDLVAFVDGHCRPRPGWLAGLMAGLDGHAAALGRTEGSGVSARLVMPTASPVARRGQAWVWPAGGAAIFDRRLLREVGAFSPLLRYWDDLYITARLRGYGQTIGYASDGVVDIISAGERPLDLACRHGYWLADLQRYSELQGWSIETAASRRGVAAAMRLGGMARAARRRGCAPRRLPVHTRSSGPARTVHLTIDDGPSPNTRTLLRILQRHGAQADFFVIGRQVSGHRGLVARMLAEGHAVHNHSFTHRPLDALSWAEIAAELDETSRLIGAGDRQERPMVRLPFGAGADDPFVHNAVARWRPGSELVQWSIDSFDYKCWPRCRSVADVEREAEAAAERVLCAPDLSGSIILMHDSAYGARLLLVDLFAQVLLDRLLAGLAHRGLATALLNRAGG